MAATKMSPIPNGKYALLLALLSAQSLFGGYYAATRPEGAGWRYFSWHPMLMMVGMVGMMGSAALTKKRGGYTNTKLHGMMAMGGMFIAAGGIYVIYQNKENIGKSHFTTYHSWAGLVAFGGSILPGIAGAVFLHPDFGIDKGNKLYRSVHKYVSRTLLAIAWMATLSGLKTLIGDDIKTLILFAAPMAMAAPFTLI
mmetsp:Transcript_20922/g.35989  ORF Transcript_20922/g.35989 Transcript_20922/m.35989 type:complete len:197 (+) Transcript_20922:51-641(+)|eukprot:CAMPEP_0183736324 /NCGR_PEP_ID=MMETSP0737-20130205/49031_1 /TAXON_ID=385413 /ORGANISM="Thalassiosira miniscula, Strain CCMP1093" /LENGTH=196 /DNA_ID=CAMNT_0025970291 /DNA_START=42 /DNA_END=632 /DNA_ORIENTATION=-